MRPRMYCTAGNSMNAVTPTVFREKTKNARFHKPRCHLSPKNYYVGDTLRSRNEEISLFLRRSRLQHVVKKNEVVSDPSSVAF